MKKKLPVKFSLEQALMGSQANYLQALKKDRVEILQSIITSRTPRKLIKIRQGKGKRSFQYVTGGAFTRALNLAFGLAWNFQVIDRVQEGRQIAVLGRLTVEYQGQQIIKEQWGSAETYEEVPVGDSYKKATTDALKKCASMLGLFGDVYGQAEEVEEVEHKPTRSRVAIEKAIEQLETAIISGEIDDAEATKRIENGLIIVRETEFNDLIDRLVQLKSQLLKK
jgi:hypothetical protein